MKYSHRYYYVLVVAVIITASCSVQVVQGGETEAEITSALENNKVSFAQWDVPHTNLTMLLPEGWVTDYYQGDIAIASDSQNFFYSPERQFEGVLIHMFLSDGPRAIGPAFDVLNLAKDYVADQPNVRQAPTLIEQDGRQIVTTYYENEDDKGKLITYLAGFVVEDQQLTVFLAATPSDTERNFLPVLEIMLRSILIKSSL